jgi:hypothetical protein
LGAFLDAPAGVLVDALVPPGFANGAQALRQKLDGVLERQRDGVTPLAGGGDQA